MGEIPSRGARVAVCLAENVGSAIYRQSGNTIYIVCSISVIWISEKNHIGWQRLPERWRS